MCRAFFPAILIGIFVAASSVPVAADGNVPHSVAFLEARYLNDAGGKALVPPTSRPLSQEEHSAVLRAIESLPAFPPNAYSGCHARAHLTYRMLDESSGGKVFKVWIFSAHTLAPALLGSIRYQGTSGQTAWGYHVAAAFLDAKFTAYVVDTLVSKSPLLLADWVQRFEIDGLAVMTFLPAPLYLFNNTEVPALDEEKFPNGLRRYIMARNVLNGNFFEYDDKSARMHDGARDLAADALSAALSKNTLPGCPWKKQAAQSLALKELATAASIPATCKKAAELFHTELARWIRAGL